MTIACSKFIKKLQDIHYVFLVSLCWKYAEGQRWKMVLFHILSMCGIVSILLQMYVFGRSIGTLQTAGDNIISELAFWCGAYIGLELLFWVFNAPSRLLERKLAFFITQNFTEDLYTKITHLPMEWHQNNHSGDVINRVKKATNGLYFFAETQFFHIHNTTMYIGSLIALMLIDLQIGLLVFGISIATLFAISKFNFYQARLEKETNEQEHFLHSALFDYIGNIFTVITLRLEQTTLAEVSKRFTKIFPPLKKKIYVNELKWFMMCLIMTILTAGSILFYVWTATGVIMVATAVLIFQYTSRINQTFERFAVHYSDLMRHSVDAKSVDNILEAYDKIDHSKEDISIGDWDTIRLNNVNFSYEDEEHLIHQLKDINIKLQKGKKIALVGESGSGKSTLMALMRGLYFADSAEVLVDDTSYEGLYPLYPISTLVPQEPEVFENTIRYNITAGLEYSEEELQEAIKVACFDAVLKTLPKGLETDIREKGVNLSGGQKQRLALARGVLSAKKRDIILLDEPTSSVDSANERQIYENLFEYYSEKCIISSIHRLNLLPSFDYIYVLDDASLVEQGTFDELISADGAFKKTWDKYSNEANTL